MLPLSLTVPLTIISLIGLVINVIVLLVVVLCKQISPNNILLFHLGIIDSLLCILFSGFSVPILVRSDELVSIQTLCSFHGILMTFFHPLALWTICGLNCDRYYAIAAPLHYNAIVNSKKVICGLLCGWCVAILSTIPPFLDIAPFRYNRELGVCTPFFAGTESFWYTIAFTICTLIIPGFLIVLCNIKVFMIARYHRHRIAAAIFEVTLSAQVTITHQRNPFPLPFEAIPPKLRSRSPVSSVIQIVGSFILLYCPYYMTILWNSSLASLHNGNTPKSLETHTSLIIGANVLLNASSVVNGILYGIKSKVMRKTIQNYWRKKKTKIEINHEIQARTPSTCGSRRPSINTATGIFTRPISQRRLSETYIDLSQTMTSDRPQMKRIASELSWRPLTLQFDISPTEPMPHSASFNTLQLPNNNDADDTDGHASTVAPTITSTAVTDNDKFQHIKNSIASSMKAYNARNNITTTTATGNHINHNISSRHSRSSFNVATALFQKVFRIDLNESFRKLPRSEQIFDMSPRSPQILITRAHSDDGEQTPVRMHSPTCGMMKPTSLTSLNEDSSNHQKYKTVRYESKDKINDSDTESIFTPETSTSKSITTNSSFSKRCFSLEETPKYEQNHLDSTDTEEQLLLSWPTARKRYKNPKDYEPKINLLFNDRSEEPEVIL